MNSSKQIARFFVLLMLYMWDFGEASNSRPIIGILTQETDPDSVPFYGDTYLPSNYVIYLQSAGARVVPVKVKQSVEYYKDMFNSINGILYPGGGVNIQTSEFAKTAKLFYDMALKAYDSGDYFPVWGTCQGFEMLMTLTAGLNPLSKCPLWDKAVPLNFTENARNSKLLRNVPDDVYGYLKTKDVTENFHHYALPIKIINQYLGRIFMNPDPHIYEDAFCPLYSRWILKHCCKKTFNESPKLYQFYRVLSTNLDENGVEFVSTAEALNYPVYALQWHPEKPMTTWNIKYHVNHGPAAIRVSHYMADFLVAEARKSNHCFPSDKKEQAASIENYSPVFHKDLSFNNYYYFNFTSV